MTEGSKNPWDLRILESDRFRGRATNVTRIKRVIEAIKSQLTKPQLEEFKKSIFGHFLEIDTNFKGMILHNVLLRLVVQTETDVPNQLWFRIGGKLIRLSIREWCIVTGLRAGNSSDEIDCETFDIRNQYFGDILYGKLSDLDTKFNNFDFTKIPDIDAVKIALYYFADRVLFARPDERRVQIKLMNAAGDLNYFNNVPWGTLTWEVVCDQANKVLLGKANKFKEDHKKNKRHIEEKYNFYGFCIGFQAWIFEAIGLVASEYAIKSDHVYPRINRWTIRGAPTDVALITLLNRANEELNTKQVLRPTKHEKTSQYWTSVRRECPYLPEWVDQFERLVGGPVQAQCADGRHSHDRTIDDKDATENYAADPMCDIETRTKCQMDYLMKRFDSIDVKVQSIQTSVDEMKKQEHEFMQTVLTKMEADREEQRCFMQRVKSFMETYTDPLYEGPTATTLATRHEEATTSVRHDETITVAIPMETTHEESVRILTHQPKGCSMFGRQYQRPTTVRSPFIVPQPKRQRLQSNIDTIVDNRTEVNNDPLKGIDDPQLLIELNQRMADVIHVRRLMNFLPSCYKILLGQEEDEWLIDKRLQGDLQMIGLKINQHEDHIKFLKTQSDKLADSILDLQVNLGNHHSSSASKIDKEDHSSHQSEEETTGGQILRHKESAAGVLYQLKTCHGTLASHLTFTKDVLGIVASLAHLEDENLSSRLSEYLGLDNMLAIVCKTIECVKALEAYDEEGSIIKSSGLHGLGASIGRAIDGRFLIICLQNLRPFAGEFVADDPQRRLDLWKPRLPNGESPSGFLGYAVNMINIDSKNLLCATASGHGLRETLFYNLFSRLQVYRTRADMLLALPSISDGAISLDGGMIRSPGIFSLGSRQEVDVRFPKSSGTSDVPAKYAETEKRIQEMKFRLENLQEDLKREQALLKTAKDNFEKKKQEFVKFLAESSTYASLVMCQFYPIVWYGSLRLAIFMLWSPKKIYNFNLSPKW